MSPSDTTGRASCATAGLDVELPLPLATAMEAFLASRPGLDAGRLLQNALAQFLVQQGAARPEVRELYLDGLFNCGL
jgi:hypothetical protein